MGWSGQMLVHFLHALPGTTLRLFSHLETFHGAEAKDQELSASVSWDGNVFKDGPVEGP